MRKNRSGLCGRIFMGVMLLSAGACAGDQFKFTSECKGDGSVLSALAADMIDKEYPFIYRAPKERNPEDLDRLLPQLSLASEKSATSMGCHPTAAEESVERCRIDVQCIQRGISGSYAAQYTLVAEYTDGNYRPIGILTKSGDTCGRMYSGRRTIDLADMRCSPTKPRQLRGQE